MGGENAGEVASALAVGIIAENAVKKFRRDADTDTLKGILLSAISSANTAIFDKASSAAEFSGMGTTVVAAFITGNSAIIAHAGDSRAYLSDGDGIIRLTKDHSLVSEMVERGLISPEEAENHPDKNLITRALGVQSFIDVDFTESELPDGKTLLLCSDGLVNFVPDEEIQKIIQTAPCRDVSRLLVEKANENGGGDNITVITIRTDEE